MSPSEAPSVVLGLLAVVTLVLANAFFVAAEFSLVGARRTRLDEMAQAGDRKALLARRVVRSLDRYISATQLGITLCSLGLGWIGEPTLARIIETAFSGLPERLGPISRDGLASVIAFTLITYTLIILGELLPKTVAIIFPERVSSWLSGPLIGFAWVAALPIALLNNSSNALLRAMNLRPPGEHQRLHSPEEIRMLVEQSQEGGSLGKADARLLEGVFEFTEKSAQDVMTPRTQVVGLAKDLTVEEAADEVATAQRSRYPVFTDTLDEIVGIVHAKDILRALRATPGASVGTIIRPPFFVPGTREVEDVLTDMKRLKVHMAVVLDEYGGTAGLVTMEDLLEEIVGDIYDEYDQQERPEPQAAGAPLLDGATTLSDFNTERNRTLDDREYTTLGGYLFGQLGRLPRVGDRVTVGQDIFEIVAMDGRRVKSVRFLAGAAPAATKL